MEVAVLALTRATVAGQVEAIEVLGAVSYIQESSEIKVPFGIYRNDN
jgi:hypothetical protein